MVVTLEEKQAQSGTKYSFIDCDIHNALPSEATLRSYLPQRWRRHHETFAMRQFPGNYLSHTNPLACRGRCLAAIRRAARFRSGFHARAVAGRMGNRVWDFEPYAADPGRAQP